MSDQERIQRLEAEIESLHARLDFAAENAVSQFLSNPIEFDAASPDGDGLLDLDCEKPFARIQYWEDRGDSSVGISGSSGFALCTDQSGTVLFDLLNAGVLEAVKA